MQYVLINPLSDNGTGDRKREEVGRIVKGEYQVLNLLEVKMKAWIKTLNAEDEVILSGGDGTINRFINDLDGECPVNPVYLWKGGTGNDFLKDIGKDDELVLLNPYLKHLPKVTVKGETRYSSTESATESTVIVAKSQTKSRVGTRIKRSITLRSPSREFSFIFTRSTQR